MSLSRAVDNFYTSRPWVQEGISAERKFFFTSLEIIRASGKGQNWDFCENKLSHFSSLVSKEALWFGSEGKERDKTGQVAEDWVSRGVLLNGLARFTERER